MERERGLSLQTSQMVRKEQAKSTSEFYDPFTGGGRYVPGGNEGIGGEGMGGDPLTGMREKRGEGRKRGHCRRRKIYSWFIKEWRNY